MNGSVGCRNGLVKCCGYVEVGVIPACISQFLCTILLFNNFRVRASCCINVHKR